MAECADAIDKKNHIVIFSRSSFADLPQAIEIELTQNVMKLKAERERCQLFGLSHNPETLADMFREMDLTGYVLQTWFFYMYRIHTVARFVYSFLESPFSRRFSFERVIMSVAKAGSDRFRFLLKQYTIPVEVQRTKS